MADDLNNLRAEFEKAAGYPSGEYERERHGGYKHDWMEHYWQGFLLAARRQPDAGVVAWAVQSKKGGIHKLAITKDSAERKAAHWQKEWPDNGCVVRPLTFADAPASPVPASVDLLALLKEATDALDGGLWDFGPGQDEHDRCTELVARLRAALKEVVPEQRCDGTNEQGRADAVDGARYRWLRDSRKSGACIRALYEDGTVVPDAVDEMIDRAIAAESAAQGGKG